MLSFQSLLLTRLTFGFVMINMIFSLLQSPSFSPCCRKTSMKSSLMPPKVTTVLSGTRLLTRCNESRGERVWSLLVPHLTAVSTMTAKGDYLKTFSTSKMENGDLNEELNLNSERRKEIYGNVGIRNPVTSGLQVQCFIVLSYLALGGGNP